MRLLCLLCCILLVTTANAQEKCGSVADCAQKAMDAAFQAKLALQVAMPKGAVLAFDLKECPQGWVPFSDLAGRVIVGAGKGNTDQNGKELTNRELAKTGGEESHTLTREELPAVRPNIFFDNDKGPMIVTDVDPCLGDGCNQMGAITAGFRNGQHTKLPVSVEALGKGAPGNNMPPFRVLLFCERQ
jgi:microcystin-dependent protein